MIKDLPIDTNGKLTADVKKQLMLVINEEFQNKESLYHQAMEVEKDKILKAYRKEIGYDGLKKIYDKAVTDAMVADERKKKAEQAIAALGLTEEGEPDTNSYYDYQAQCNRQNYKGKELAKRLAVIEKNAPSQNLKAKLISRLMLSTTVGEATTIMREVLGNGIIPATDVKAITFQE